MASYLPTYNWNGLNKIIFEVTPISPINDQMTIFIKIIDTVKSQAMNDDYPYSINWITVWTFELKRFFSLDFYSLIRHYYHNPFNLLLCYVVETQSTIPSS